MIKIGRVRTVFSFVLAVALLYLLSGCGIESDARYMGWNRYTDEDDNYIIFVPERWQVEDESMLDMRGTRLYDPDVLAPTLATYLYFSIFVRDQKEGDDALGERAEALVRSLTDNIWCESEITSSETRLSGRQAYRFRLKGDSCFDGISLTAIVIVAEFKGKDFVLFASSTESRYLSLEETFELIIASFRWPM